MSRIRFHSIRALFNHKQVNGIYTGPGWDNWVSTISVQTNLDNILKGKECHLVIGYKPLEYSGFAAITYYKCIRIHNKNTLKCEKLFNSWIKCISNISLKIE